LIVEEEKDDSGASGAIVKETVFDVPPPGDGLFTVNDAVPLVPKSVPGKTAFKIEFETYAV
jgi:hypothetical protein